MFWYDIWITYQMESGMHSLMLEASETSRSDLSDAKNKAIELSSWKLHFWRNFETTHNFWSVKQSGKQKDSGAALNQFELIWTNWQRFTWLYHVKVEILSQYLETWGAECYNSTYTHASNLTLIECFYMCDGCTQWPMHWIWFQNWWMPKKAMKS